MSQLFLYNTLCDNGLGSAPNPALRKASVNGWILLAVFLECGRIAGRAQTTLGGLETQ